MSAQVSHRHMSLDRIAHEGADLYDRVREQYEPVENGDYLAIETHYGDLYKAETFAEALAEARKSHPGEAFYVVRIGQSNGLVVPVNAL